ncbi:MAG: ATP-binding protein [Chloroflexales bacterium]
MRRLFQPFIQPDSRLNRQHEGTGLGLALVRRLAELHGGSVTVESELGQDSRFTIALPYTSREMMAQPDYQDTPIIAVTALAMPGDREQCLAAGVNEYLTKPVRLKGLVETMQRLLKSASIETVT